MDRFLRSLLTSSVGASVDTDKSLSEIARSVLAESPEGDGKTLREKAGLLALLNLLGIVEAFYGEMPVSEETAIKLATAAPPAAQPATSARDVAVGSLLQTPPQPSTPAVAPSGAPASPISIASTLAKLIGSMQPPAQAQPQQQQPASQATAPAAASGSPLANILGSLDPAMIASILGLISTLAKPRPAARAVTKVEAQAADGAVQEGETAEPAPAGDADSPGTAPDQAGGEKAGAPANAPTGPSPLQQLLGIDPKFLTLILNVLAEVMKARQLEAKDKPAEPKAGREERSSEPAASAAEARPAPVARRTPGFRAHRPGLGIYRSAPAAAKAEPVPAKDR